MKAWSIRLLKLLYANPENGLPNASRYPSFLPPLIERGYAAVTVGGGCIITLAGIAFCEDELNYHGEFEPCVRQGSLA